MAPDSVATPVDPEFADLLKEEPGTTGDEDGNRAAAYRDRFRTIRRNEIIATILVVIWILALLGIMALAMGTNLTAPTRFGPLLILSTFGVVGGSVFMIANWRCPRCRRYLGHATSLLRLYFPDVKIRSCPYCGLSLR